MIWLHRLATLVAGATLMLVAVGGLVASTGSGLSVPALPSSDGWPIVAVPVSREAGGLFPALGHRLIANTVGLLTLVLAAGIWRTDTRPWVKAVGLVAVVAVVAQGVLGSLAVKWLLPAPIAVAHAGLAQLCFAVTVALALVTSRGWIQGYDGATSATAARDDRLRRLLLATPIVVFVQILLGATMRHTGAGLAIPDFPLAFGQLAPLSRLSDPGVGVHFTHRVVALVAAGFVFASAWRVWSWHRVATYLVRPAVLASGLVLVQMVLGAATVLSGRDLVVSTAHVVSGAVTFATTVVLAMRSSRGTAGVPLSAPVPTPQRARG